MILDTSFLEDVARGEQAAIEEAERLDTEVVPQHVSVMSLYELYWGIGYLDTPRSERERVDSVLESKPTYAVTPEIARKAGRIAGRLSSEGRPLNDPGDEIIGATGIVHDEPVLTANVDHFERIDGLDVVTY